ncbi:formate dehydrogenase accessory protein FdhE [Paracoccus zeaxanthinifaciens]|uniref:formate dehydrogenase accessory protein FdhE n=1 Tax=Paracoccus zeaxanthinifaciens TaxID=187400 RepID=UPI0003B392BA|nr:formate dehydrogenase accessory protein FdhE [Paracoccus zeaxanthinifaciens]
MTTTIQPDPTVIGGVPQAPLAFLPNPARLFATRARRFDFLSQHSQNLAPYLKFLGELVALQDRIARDLPQVTPVPRDRIDLARESRMPPIDRAKLATDPDLHILLDRFLSEAQAIEMPEEARLALSAVISAGVADRHWLVGNILSDTIPDDSAAPHLFASLAVQLHLARLAATLDADALVPIRTGVCPSCGGRAATSSLTTVGQLEGVRYATCACCQTRWNEVRVTCLCCGSNEDVSYRSVETAEATVRAEECGKCGHWVKILTQTANHSLEPIADDVGSLGLDLLMKDKGVTRGGFNPFLAGF